MKYSGIYLIGNPSNTLDTSVAIVNTVVAGIEQCFPTAVRQTPWALRYQVFRDIIPPSHNPPTDAEGKPKPFAHTLQHHLHHSAIEPNRAYLCTQPPVGTSTVNAIPLSQQDAQVSLVKNHFAALWQMRHALFIQQGTTYTGGVCTVHIGELRSKREGSQSVQSPGVVVCISTVVGSDDLEEETKDSIDKEEEAEVFDYAQGLIRDFWSQVKNGRDFGKSDIREVMMAPSLVHGFREKDAAVRMWCEVLRLRE